MKFSVVEASPDFINTIGSKADIGPWPESGQSEFLQGARSRPVPDHPQHVAGALGKAAEDRVPTCPYAATFARTLTFVGRGLVNASTPSSTLAYFRPIRSRT